jgi:hypothetical protein
VKVSTQMTAKFVVRFFSSKSRESTQIEQGDFQVSIELTTWGSPPSATLATCRSSISTLLLPFPLRQYAANSSPSSSTSFLGSASTAATAAAAAAAAVAPAAGTTSGAGRRLFSTGPAGADATAAPDAGWGDDDGEGSSRSSARSAKGRSGEPAGAAADAGPGEAATAGSGEADAALQESGRREGEKTGELGMATVQDIAGRRRWG